MRYLPGLLKNLCVTDWERKSTALLSAIFAAQILWLIEDHWYWHNDTRSAAQWVLIAIAAVEVLLPRLSRASRLSLHLVSILAIVAAVGGYRPVATGILHPSQWGGLLHDNTAPFYPYFWFAVVVWALFLFIYWWMHSKARIVIALLLSVLTFAIVDSFSQYLLWKQVAAFIFCGLFLLAVQHFRKLRSSNPAGWASISEYPLSIAVPIVLMISLTVLVGTLAPDIHPVWNDPYTVWFGDSNRGAGSGGSSGGSQDDNPSSDFNYPKGNASSGYSRNDEKIGGGFDFNYTPIMQVTTDHRSYWRGETKSVYNGKGWSKAKFERQDQQSGIQFDQPLESKKPSKLKTVEVHQSVAMMTEDKYPVLFGSLTMSMVKQGELVDPALVSSLSWSQGNAELRWRNKDNGEYPRKYSVVSEMPVIDEAGLRAAGNDAPSLGNHLEDYLELPDSLPNRVRKLAEKITEKETNSYDKAKALEAYLSETFPYNNKPDLSKGRSKDLVDRFLFEIREGYCDYYSTSMVVMARSLGIPARWVKGYSSGNLPVDDFRMHIPSGQIDPNGGGTYIVRNSDAHSWAEVYFEGYGWIPFEPTAGFFMPTVTPAGEDIPASLDDPGDAGDTAIKSGGEAGWVKPAAIAASVLVLLAAAVWALSRTRGIALIPWRRRAAALNNNQRIADHFENFLQSARRKGLLRQEHETARETFARWCKDNKWLQKDLEELLVMFERAKYSGAAMDDSDVEWTTARIGKLNEEL